MLTQGDKQAGEDALGSSIFRRCFRSETLTGLQWVHFDSLDMNTRP